MSTPPYARVTTDSPVITDFSSSGPTLLVAFAGARGRLSVPNFEFMNLTADLHVPKIFARDLEQCWYHRGMAGIAGDIPGIAGYLEEQIAKPEIRRTVFVGNSMGGYAAILFGALEGADVVHAFAPRTFLGVAARLAHRDWTTKKQCLRLYRSPNLSKRFFDLRKVLREGPRQHGAIHIHYESTSRWDRLHATRMRDLPGVVLHDYALEAGHELVRHLRDRGVVEDLLRSSIQEPGSLPLANEVA